MMDPISICRHERARRVSRLRAEYLAVMEEAKRAYIQAFEGQTPKRNTKHMGAMTPLSNRARRKLQGKPSIN